MVAMNTWVKMMVKHEMPPLKLDLSLLLGLSKRNGTEMPVLDKNGHKNWNIMEIFYNECLS